MSKIKIFLSGSVQKNFSELNIGKKYWEDNEEQILKEELCFDVELLNPNSITVNKSDREGRFVADIKMLLESHIVLVDGIGKKGIGIGAEMALAKNWKIPVFTIAPLGSHYRKINENGEEWIHPFIYELSDKIFNDLNEFIEYVNLLYKSNRLLASKHIDIDTILNQYNSFDGGYDDGYRSVDKFWGMNPANFVVHCTELLQRQGGVDNVKCLDLGCGHGKNAIFLNKKGFCVDAWDSSYYAIQEAKKQNGDVNWKVRDIKKLYVTSTKYQMILMTGCLHCLASKEEVEKVVYTAQNITCTGGYHVLYAFNSSCQDLSGHPSNFHPILLSHQDYLAMYNNWIIIKESNITQNDEHKNNNITHKHSITRILAQKI